MQETTRPMAVKKTALPHRRKPRRLSALWIGLLAIILLLIIAVIGTFAYLEVNQVILPGVHVYTLDLSYKTKGQAEDMVDQFWNHDAKLQLTMEGQLYEVSAADLGLRVDPVTTVEDAYQVGRGADGFREIKTLFQEKSTIILPDLTFNKNTARQLLETLAQTVNVPPVNAQIQRVDNTYIAIPGQPGSILDVETPLVEIKTNPLLVLTQGMISLQMLPVQPAIADLTPLLDEISLQLQQEYTLTAYDPITDEHLSWTVPPDSLINWLQIDQENSRVSLEPTIETIQPILDGWEESLQPERRLALPEGVESILQYWISGRVAKAEIIHNPTAHVVQPGESLWSISLDHGMPLYRILDANPGLTEYNLYNDMELTIPSLNDLLPLPVIENKRIVISISDQHMWTYENGQLRSEYVISTGMEDSPTMAGIFQIQSRYLDAYASNWDLWMPHFLGIYEAWPDFMNGIHGLPLLSSGVRLWGGSLGTPASYGCIILDLDAAESLYYWAEDGVVVEIQS